MTNPKKIAIVIALVLIIFSISSTAFAMDMRADIDGNGEITSADAVYLLRHVLMPESYPSANSTDVDGDGIETSADAIYLFRHMISPEQYPIKTEPLRYSHFSIDDFYLAFEDLTVNKDTYTSIFDNETFAWLKEFHEATGATVSCYCFYQNSDASFTLDMVPSKYAKEFKANQDWLRFGFHALKSGINYASASSDAAKEAYEKTINALLKITGSPECIDRMPRLHNFAGSLEACKGMKTAVCGPIGFLAAISAADGTARQSYYLNQTDNQYIFTHDYLYDEEHHFHFVRTQNGSTLFHIDKLVQSEEYADLNTYVEFFTHEIQLTSGTKSSFKNAYNKLKKTMQGS